jgi:hypothetical protein
MVEGDLRSAAKGNDFNLILKISYPLLFIHLNINYLHLGSAFYLIICTIVVRI